jgi:excisionase family DNA binding protein
LSRRRKPTAALTRTHIRLLWTTANALFAYEVARERTYTLRRYQVKAAVRAVLFALDGRNIGIELPTGTGKTLIACLAAVFWKQLRPKSRVLLIVPSRTLVVQHFDVALWVAPLLTVDRLTDYQSGHPADLRRVLLRSDLLISTPGILGGALARGLADEDVVASFDFVIVDEFDQFVVIDEADREGVARYAQLWQRLLSRLPASARFLVKSATLGLAARVPTARSRGRARQRANLISIALNPVSIVVPERSYAAVVPFMSIQKTQLNDGHVTRLLEAVNVAKGRAHLRLDEAAGPVDYKDVERRAPQLCQGPTDRSVQIRSPGGAMDATASSQPAELAYTLREVQELVGISRSTIYLILGARELRAVKSGRKTLIWRKTFRRG